MEELRQQVAEQGRTLDDLRAENEHIRRSQLIDASVSVVNCPVCYDSSTTPKQMVVLLCGHFLCVECRGRINRERRNRHCPSCRIGDVASFIEIFL